jgi:SAM-dependent methyltransferase
MNTADTAAGADFIERLNFDDGQPYEPIEAAIHLARYQLASGMCAKKRVLDVACGAGYGAEFMTRRWGAESVDGVDVSPEAIEQAKKLFGSTRNRFHCSDVAQLGALFGDAKFDLITSLETIEHLTDPVGFLQTLKKLLAPGGTIILSCPNDHWYYVAPEQKNPFHIRKYTFEEFRATTEAVLGPARGFMLGAPVAGFLNIAVDSRLLSRKMASPATMLDADSDIAASVVPTTEEVNASNCSYFVAVWGPAEAAATMSSTLYPCSMDQAEQARLQEMVQGLRQEVETLHAQLRENQQVAQELRRNGIRVLALARENELLRTQMREVRMGLLPHDAVPGPGTTLLHRIRWAATRIEPGFPEAIGPIRRAYRRWFLRE